MGYIKPDKNLEVKCSACRGRGYTGGGMGHYVAHHPYDDGEVYVPKETCKVCGGRGKVIYTKDEHYMYLLRNQKK